MEMILIVSEDSHSGLAKGFHGQLFDELAGFLRRGGKEYFDEDLAA